jgi:hypothetical protein
MHPSSTEYTWSAGTELPSTTNSQLDKSLPLNNFSSFEELQLNANNMMAKKAGNKSFCMILKID